VCLSLLINSKLRRSDFSSSLVEIWHIWWLWVQITPPFNFLHPVLGNFMQFFSWNSAGGMQCCMYYVGARRWLCMSIQSGLLSPYLCELLCELTELPEYISCITFPFFQFNEEKAVLSHNLTRTALVWFPPSPTHETFLLCSAVSGLMKPTCLLYVFTMQI
jgi:hypothetical protein